MAGKRNAKYGYICMTCGKTIPEGVNKDGECKMCANHYAPSQVRMAVERLHQRQVSKNLFTNIGTTEIMRELKKIRGY